MASNIVLSSTKGISLPSFTTTEKNAIVSPATGAVVYDTTLNQESVYNGSAWVNVNTSGNSAITSGTAVASTSDTSIDFTGIPSWVKRITVMFSGVSTNATDNFLIQIGSGSVETSGYLSAASSGTTISTSTAGFILTNVTSAGSAQYGNLVICNQTGNTWVESGTLSLANATALNVSAGSKLASGVIDRMRITTVAASTFDAGSINILYE